MALAIFQHNSVLSQAVIKTLVQFQTEQQQFPFDKNLLEPIEKFAVSGKLFRGGLCLSAISALKSESNFSAASLAAAVALELTGSAILIQDDIMDEALLRRGLMAIDQQYTQFVSSALSKAVRSRYGESAAMCVSDVLLFLATKILSQVEARPELKLKLISVLSQELTTLALNQAEELRFAALPLSHSEVTEAKILQIMIGKTARYSVNWPLKFAGVLAELADPAMQALAVYGEAAGLVFQLSDDRIGLLGEVSKTGKDVDSDAKTGKKTLYALYANQMLIGEKAQKFKLLYGKPDLNSTELVELQHLLKQTGVTDRVDKITAEYVTKAKLAVAHLSTWPKLQALLIETVDFLASREH